MSTHVVPQAHDENHALGSSGAHLGKAALVVEGALVAEDGLLEVAVVLGDGVAGDALDERLRVLNDDAVLDVEALDLGKTTIALDELGDDSDDLGGVNGELRAGTVERGVALAVAVEVAAIGVAVTAITVGGVSSAASVTLARVLGAVLTGVRGVSGGDVVGLPDIHLSAAAAHGTDTSVGIVGGALPALRVGLVFWLAPGRRRVRRN